MSRKQILFVPCIVVLAGALLAGCSGGGGSASSDQMEAARDAQSKSMENQKKMRETNRGASSIEAAGRAGGKPSPTTGN